MPVFIFQKNAFKKMIQVEGEGFRERENDTDDYSFKAFHDHWKNLSKNNKRYSPRVKAEFTISVHDSSTIYGFGGWHRYVVMNNGEILLIKSSVLKWKQEWILKKAKKVGFKIF
ncbi:MAG: hypothetical protein AAB432_02260 [Patescibacteria group bacterium]